MEVKGSNPFAGASKIIKEYYHWEQFDIDIRTILQQIEEKGKTYTGIYAIPRGGLVLGVRLSHELDIPMVMGGVTDKTLVVDEICDTGRALRPFLDRCNTLTIFKHQDCPVTPTYWLRSNINWVVFPWEKQ